MNWLIGILIFINIFTIFAANVDYDGSVNIDLYHALNDGIHSEFTPRGNVTILSLRSETVAITNTPLTTNEKKQLIVLARSGKSYRLQAVVHNLDGTETKLLTSVKACMLVESQLYDRLTFSLDYTGSVIGVSQSIPNAQLCDKTDTELYISEFYTMVYIQHAEQGPIPDTASYIQKIEREREARERGDIKDNRSFLAKYWMYIVPVVIFMIISSAANPEGAAGGVAQSAR